MRKKILFQGIFYFIMLRFSFTNRSREVKPVQRR